MHFTSWFACEPIMTCAKMWRVEWKIFQTVCCICAFVFVVWFQWWLMKPWGGGVFLEECSLWGGALSVYALTTLLCVVDTEQLSSSCVASPLLPLETPFLNNVRQSRSVCFPLLIYFSCLIFSCLYFCLVELVSCQAFALVLSFAHIMTSELW